ncbi:MAG: primosomal replication protein [Alteromonadaceae bacterium]|nr:primosomal replication protein [Alteromonadaceae bacterium]
MKNDAIDRINTVLINLAEQAKTTDAINTKTKAHLLLKDNALFSETLFVTYSDKFFSYVQEIKRNTATLQRLINAKKPDVAYNQLTHIEQQIASLINALNSNQAMHNEAQHRLNAFKTRRYKKAAKSIMLTSHSLHQKLAETHEFERRLADMITDREKDRLKATPAKAKKIATEILAIHQRLGRCRQAISKIERQIELSEKR